MSRPTISDADQNRIRDAVASAEKQTSGEIVPYVVGRSGSYDVAIWRGASIGALTLSATALGIASTYSGWDFGWLYSAWGMALAMLIGGIAGSLLAAFVAPAGRFFAGSAVLRDAVRRRALEAFVAEEVFNTHDRTGILLFVSLYERRIEVLGDTGINAKVQPGEWIRVVERIEAGVKKGALADGLVDAIGTCGELLNKRGVDRRENDTDELPDELRFRDR